MRSGSQTIYVPDRGDILWIDFSPHQGHEQGNKRPAIILSPIKYNRMVSLALMCPITNKSKGFQFEVSLPGGMQTSGVVLSDQVKSFDWKARHVEFIEQAPPELIEDVLAKVQTLLT